MRKFSFLLAFIFIVLLFSNVSAQEGAAWQVTKYDINATLPSASTDRNLNAKAVVSLKNIGRGAGATATFRISSKAEVIAAQVGEASAVNFRKTTNDKIGELQRFTISLPASVQPNGTVVITISYRLTVGENNGLNAISTVGSQFLPLSTWYPTPNNPYSTRGADYAPFHLQINGVASGENVISSGTASGTTFEQSLFAQPFFVSGVWDLVEGTNGTTAYLPKGAGSDQRKRAQEIISLTNEAKLFTASLLGGIPDISFRLVAVRRGAGFADGGTILLDYAAFQRQKIDEATAMTIAEAVAKVWLGNATALRGDGFGVIKEGLARFIATQFIEKQFGKEAATIERLRQRISYVAVAKRDDEPPLVLNSPPSPTYFASVPNKGAMIWRLIAREMGEASFFETIRSQLQAGKSGSLNLSQLRESLILAGGDKVKAILNYELDQTTDMDLLVGLPTARGTDTVVALRNTGNLATAVNIRATTEKGDNVMVATNIAAKNFGEAIFKTSAKITRVEVDPDKLYPQIDYSNDFAPHEITENDLSAAIAVLFNRQDFVKAETMSRKVLSIEPHFDDARTWLGRALLEQNRLDEAEKEFDTAIKENLPGAKTLAWSNIGLGEIAVKRNQNTSAVIFYDNAVKADAEYASNLAARQGRLKAESASAIEEAAKTFFAAFDKAVVTARKAEVENYVLPGELISFVNRLTANQPEQWQTKVLRTESLDANRMTVEISLAAKLLNKELSSGTALFVLAKTANGWKLAAVDLFEVR